MVVIVLVAEDCAPWGSTRPRPRPRPRPVTYVSCVIVNADFVSQVEPGDTFATTKEEEWVSKKKTELLTTRQIETRVKRQVVLEDGKVVEDSGPVVTTNTSEDTEKKEHAQTELRKLGGDEADGAEAIAAGAAPAEGGKVAVKKDWVPCPNPDGVVREVKEKRVISREETEETKETENIQHLGDITDEDFIAAVHSGEQDLRTVFRERNLNGNHTVVSTGPRLVHESTKKRKVTDTEDTAAVSSVRPDGKIVTETTRTTEHEEVKDDELPESAPEIDKLVENSERYKQTKDQEFVEYLADGVTVGQEMRYKGETMEGERHGEGLEDPHDWDSLSTRIRRERRHQISARAHVQKPRGLEEQAAAPPLDRKDALTRKPLDFDEEEETRKAETSKWLEHHFGSESTRSSRDSIDEPQEDEKATHSKTFFNVTIKSQPARVEPSVSRSPYIPPPPPLSSPQRVYSPSPEPEIKTPVRNNGYFQGISEWTDRKHEEVQRVYHRADRAPYTSITSNGNGIISERSERQERLDRPINRSSHYRLNRSDEIKESVTPTPPERKRNIERRQRSSQDSIRYDSGYRTHSRNEMSHDEPQDEPPPDYSPPPPSPPAATNKKSYQRTRFAADSPPISPPPVSPPPKAKHGNIIGQSIRKLVGKIRSASAERKARRERAKRSPSPQTTYQQYNVIDNNIPTRRGSREGESPSMDASSRRDRRTASPVQRYYLGEDPFGGSIYGRENKYDGVRPARNSARHRNPRRGNNQEEEVITTHSSTLGRFSKSTSRLANDSVDYTRSAQTLPRNIRSDNSYRSNQPRTNPSSNGTINVSIINKPLVNGGPAKPARTYKSHLSRSKSFNVHAGGHESSMHKSNPHLHRLEENPIGLKSPGIVSSLTRSTRDLTDTTDHSYAPSPSTKYASGTNNGYESNKKVFLKGLKDRAPDLYKTLQSDDEEYSARKWQLSNASKSRIATSYNNNIYEPPTRLSSTESTSYQQPPAHSVLRRGSSHSTDDFSETYHTTTRNADPRRPSVTDTVHTVSKKTVPAGNGRKMQTIESTETKSVTRSRFRGEPMTNVKYLDSKMNSNGASNSGVIIEVKNYRN